MPEFDVRFELNVSNEKGHDKGVLPVSAAMENRRAHPRIAAPLKASWHRGSVRCVTRTVNLSLGGCFLESLDRKPPTGRFRLRLQLPRNEFIWLSGEVAHFASERGFGVKFVNLSDESAMALNRAIGNLTGRPLL